MPIRRRAGAQRLDAAGRRLVHPAARLAGSRIECACSESDWRARFTIARRWTRAGSRRPGRGSCANCAAPCLEPIAVLQFARTLERAGQDRLARASRVVQRLRDALVLLNPAAVLERGYSIVTGASGTIITDARQLQAGEAIALAFAKGSAAATLTAVEPAKDD